MTAKSALAQGRRLPHRLVTIPSSTAVSFQLYRAGCYPTAIVLKKLAAHVIADPTLRYGRVLHDYQAAG